MRENSGFYEGCLSRSTGKCDCSSRSVFYCDAHFLDHSRAHPYLRHIYIELFFVPHDDTRNIFTKKCDDILTNLGTLRSKLIENHQTNTSILNQAFSKSIQKFKDLEDRLYELKTLACRSDVSCRYTEWDLENSLSLSPEDIVNRIFN